MRVPQPALVMENEIQQTLGEFADKIVNKSITRCAKEGLPLAMIAFGTTIKEREEVAYLYHPLKTNLFSQFYIPVSQMLPKLQQLGRELQIGSN